MGMIFLMGFERYLDSLFDLGSAFVGIQFVGCQLFGKKRGRKK